MNPFQSLIFRMLGALFRLWGCVSLLAAAEAGQTVTRPQIDLTGIWDFYADAGNASLDELTSKPGKIMVPGSWQAQGYGREGGTIPSANIGPGISPAPYLRHNLMARCLYVRSVGVPSEWQGRRVFLCVRRAYRYTDVTVNGSAMGEYEGFSSPFEFDITSAIHFGQSNLLVMGVDNRPRPGRDTLGTGNLYGNWGGLGGKVYLEARAPVWISEVFAMPKIASSEAILRVTVKSGEAPLPQGLEVRGEVAPYLGGASQTQRAGMVFAQVQSSSNSHTLDLPVSINPTRLWSPDDPFLYRVQVELMEKGKQIDRCEVRFGMREITARGKELLLNGKPVYLSGYGDDATEPLTGMLPADKSVYKRRLSLMRSLGFNFVRHHSCVPHDEYLEAADETGMLVQPEGAVAYTGFWRTGHELFAKEWPEIIKAFRNHPSIYAWCMGNELFLNELPSRATNSASPAQAGRQEILKLVETAYRQAKELDPTRLVHASDGGTPQEFTDILSSGGGEKFGPKPFLLHEYGTYCCSLPDFNLIPRLNGVIRPLTYERAYGYVREHHLESVYPKLYRSSLCMRADAQKHYMEQAKASRSNTGFSFWLGVDFPDSPEGCWDEGILNQLWEPKPYLTDTLLHYTGATVVLITPRLEARSFFADEAKRVSMRLWHYGSEPIEDGRLIWCLRDGLTVLKSGEIHPLSCPPGEIQDIGEVVIDPPGSDAPRFITLQVELRAAGQRVSENSWEFYAYPRPAREARPGVYSEAGPLPGATELGSEEDLPPDARLIITPTLKSERHGSRLKQGQVAVLLLGNAGFKEERAGYFLNQYGAGFGGIIEDHPVFSSIPHQGRLHLGLYQLVAGGGLLDAESMPAALREGSIVWGLRLTGWISPEKNLRWKTQYCDVLASNGVHLVLSSLDLVKDRPESRFVLDRTLDYLLSGPISPAIRKCDINDILTLLK